MNPVIVIPTFVSARRRKEGGSVLTTYDHATPISQPGELPRLLASLQKVRGAGQIIVLVVSEPSIENQAAEKVQSVVSRFPSLNTVVVGAPELALIQQRMEQLGLGKLQKEIGLSGYGAVRNLGLVMADVLGFDSVVFLDDDEVVDDADFLQKAMYGWASSRRRAFPSWPRPASTSIPKAPTCRRARTSGTTISGSRERPSTNGSRSHARPSSFPIEPYVRRLPCFA